MLSIYAVIRSYAWDTSGRQLYVKSGSNVWYEITDPHGDVAALATGTGLAGTEHFDAWGNQVASSGSTIPFGYQGSLSSWTDTTTGLVSMGVRWYYPKVSLFTSSDPAAGTADPRTPIDRMHWLYAANDPLVHSDPTGLRGCADPSAPCTDPFVHSQPPPPMATVPPSTPAPSGSGRGDGFNHDTNVSFLNAADPTTLRTYTRSDQVSDTFCKQDELLSCDNNPCARMVALCYPQVALNDQVLYEQTHIDTGVTPTQIAQLGSTYQFHFGFTSGCQVGGCFVVPQIRGQTNLVVDQSLEFNQVGSSSAVIVIGRPSPRLDNNPAAALIAAAAALAAVSLMSRGGKYHWEKGEWVKGRQLPMPDLNLPWSPHFGSPGPGPGKIGPFLKKVGLAILAIIGIIGSSETGPGPASSAPSPRPAPTPSPSPTPTPSVSSPTP